MSRDRLKVSLSALARRDLRQAREWYDKQRKGLGDEFAAAFAETLDRVVDLPESFPIVHDGARRARMRRFPYGVFFPAFPATRSA